MPGGNTYPGIVRQRIIQLQLQLFLTPAPVFAIDVFQQPPILQNPDPETSRQILNTDAGQNLPALLFYRRNKCAQTAGAGSPQPKHPNKNIATSRSQKKSSNQCITSTNVKDFMNLIPDPWLCFLHSFHTP